MKCPAAWACDKCLKTFMVLCGLYDSECRQGNQDCSLEEAAVRQSSMEGPQGKGSSRWRKDKGTGRETSQTRAC